MNLESLTIQDCIDIYEKQEKATIINGGKIIGFVPKKEECTE